MASPSRTDRSRALILDAADTAFRASGIEATSMDTIALAAGLTRKTVYNLFGSKDEIALALIARVEAGDAGYRARIAANEDAVLLLERILLDSAGWCLANPALARLALLPAERPTPQLPNRPSFQGLVRDVVALGQQQGRLRSDENAGFIALLILGIYGQAMLSALPSGKIPAADIRRILRLLREGIGA